MGLRDARAAHLMLHVLLRVIDMWSWKVARAVLSVIPCLVHAQVVELAVKFLSEAFSELTTIKRKIGLPQVVSSFQVQYL